MEQHPVSSELNIATRSRGQGSKEASSSNNEMQIDDGGGNNNASTSKNPTKRRLWTTSLLKKFDEAINEIGLANATPSKILRHMNVPELTHKHISSHLQKYRNRLRRQKESNESSLASSLRTTNIASQTPLMAGNAVQGQSTRVQHNAVIGNLENIVYGEIDRARMFIDNAISGKQAVPLEKMNVSADQQVNMPYASNTAGNSHPATVSTMNQQVIMPSNASNTFTATPATALSNMNDILSADRLASWSNMMHTVSSNVQPLLPSNAGFIHNGDTVGVSNSNLNDKSTSAPIMH